MELQNRYIVIKRKHLDLLTDTERNILLALVHKIDCQKNLHPGQINYLVLEPDWPEFQPALKALEDRVDREIHDCGESEHRFPAEGGPVLPPAPSKDVVDSAFFLKLKISSLEKELRCAKSAMDHHIQAGHVLAAENNRLKSTVSDLDAVMETTTKDLVSARHSVRSLIEDNDRLKRKFAKALEALQS